MAEKPPIGIAYYVYRAYDDVERIKGEIPFVMDINGVDGNLEIAVQEGAEGLPDVALVRDVVKNCSNGEGTLCVVTARYPGRDNTAAALELSKLIDQDGFPENYEHPLESATPSWDIVWQRERSRMYLDTEWLDKFRKG